MSLPALEIANARRQHCHVAGFGRILANAVNAAVLAAVVAAIAGADRLAGFRQSRGARDRTWRRLELSRR